MRSLLIIGNSHSATTYIRARQYDALFQRYSRFKTAYAIRQPTRFNNLRARLEHRWWTSVAARALHRLTPMAGRRQEERVLRQARESDVVYLVRVPSWKFHKALWEQQSAKIVMDFNDGLWLPYHRGTGYEQLDEMLAHSHAIVCENETLAAYARRHNANVHIVPDAPQLEAFDAQRPYHRPPADRVTLGWIGGTMAADNFGVIFEPLEEIFRRHTNLHLRVLGVDLTRLPRFEHVDVSCKPVYTNAEMIAEALRMDIGLFPLYRTQDSIARGTLKARIYMSAGIVAACQDWGPSRELIQDRVNGVLAGTPDEWVESLDWLIRNPDQRAAIAARGLETMRSEFTTAGSFEKLAAALESV
jgi:glycosyltransferase involved in cell wall biosynthesis